MSSHLKIGRVSAIRSAIDPFHVIYDGSLSLWRLSTNLNILIVRHDGFNCIECIAYDPLLDQEAPRIYVNSSKVGNKIPHTELANVIASIQEPLVRNHEPFNRVDVERQAVNALVVKYITTRLTIDAERKSAGELYVYLKPQLGDNVNHIVDGVSLVCGASFIHECCLDVIIYRPPELRPACTVHISNLRTSMFVKCLAAFQETTPSTHNSDKTEVLTAFIYTVNTSATTELHIKAKTIDMSPAKLRWKKAINRVVHVIAARKMRNLLKEQERFRLLHEILHSPPTTADSADYIKVEDSTRKKVMRRPLPLLEPLSGGDYNSSPSTQRGSPRFSTTTSPFTPVISPSLLLHLPPMQVTPSHRSISGIITKPIFSSPKAAAAASKAAINSREDRLVVHGMKSESMSLQEFFTP